MTQFQECKGEQVLYWLSTQCRNTGGYPPQHLRPYIWRYSCNSCTILPKLVHSTVKRKLCCCSSIIHLRKATGWNIAYYHKCFCNSPGTSAVELMSSCVWLSIYPSVCLFVYLCLCPFLSVCLVAVCLPLCMCLSVCPFSSFCLLTSPYFLLMSTLQLWLCTSPQLFTLSLRVIELLFLWKWMALPKEKLQYSYELKMGMPQVAWVGGWSWQQVSCAVSPSAFSDYSAVSQEVVFPAGTTQRSVNIYIIEDSVLEAVEFFYVEMTVPPSHAGVVLLGTDTTTIRITDDDSK